MSELPKGWVSVCLNDVVDKIVGGGTPSKSKPSYYTGEIPWMTVKDMNKLYLTDTIDHITQEAVDNSSTNVIPAGTPIIATRMSLGKIVRANFDSAINQDLKAIFVNSSINKFYFEYWYRSKSMLIESLGTGTTVKGVRLEVLKDLKFPLSSLNEQKRIVEKLDEVLAQVDTIKARLDGIPAILKRFRQSVLAAAVSGKLTEEWRLENDNQPHIEEAYYSTKKYGDVSDDEMYENIPNSWAWVRFGSLVDLINGDRGKNYPNKSEYVEKGIAFINTGHIDPDGTLSTKRMNYISEDKFASLGSGKIQKNDIVYCLRGATMGKTAIVDPIEIGAIASSLVIVRPSDSMFYKFTYYFLVSPQAKEQILRFDNGSAQPNLSAKSLGMYPIGLPPINEQKEIVRLVDQYFAFADTIEAQVKKAQARVDNLTQSILAKAFRGELVEQDPNDEPADKLLERIAAARKEAEALAKAAKKAQTAKKRTVKKESAQES
ncbi:TPA: restriction endonuclease subunit S [Photobacterium damselae]